MISHLPEGMGSMSFADLSSRLIVVATGGRLLVGTLINQQVDDVGSAAVSAPILPPRHPEIL
jgi:hypothetical protein